MTIRVSLISNHHLTTWGLVRLFQMEAVRFEWVASWDKFDQSTIDAVVAAAPDVVILDIDSDPSQVLPLIAGLHAAAPGAKILLLTRLCDTALQDSAIIGGARGVVDKTVTPEQLLTAVAKVHEGQLWLDRTATGRIFVEFSRMGTKPTPNAFANQIASLTERERLIVAFIAGNSGERGKTVAAKLNISESTLRNHLTVIYEKIGVDNRGGLLAWAFQNGLTKQLAK